MADFKMMKYCLLCLTALICLCSCTSVEYKTHPPVGLSVNEGLKNPLGFHTSNLRFSWKLPPGSYQVQQAYDVRVASTIKQLSSPDLWRSGKVLSRQSTFVQYEGKPIGSRDQFFWQVRTWNERGQPSAWSKAAVIELGLLNNTDWQAQWIGLTETSELLFSKQQTRLYKTRYFRKPFVVENINIKKARLYVTAKGLFEASINGKKVGDTWMTPGWTPYQKRIETLTYDVTAMLNSGSNAIGLALAPGWHSGRMGHAQRHWIAKPAPQGLAQLEIVYENGQKHVIATDHTWKGTTNGPIVYSEIYDGEQYDARLDIRGWNTALFSDREWLQAETSPIADDVKLLPKSHPPVRVKHTLPAISVQEISPGVAIFDLGQNMVGVPRLKIPVKKGRSVKVNFAEMLKKKDELYTDNYRTALSRNEYIPNTNGIVEWSPTFTFHGFRYLSIDGYDADETPDVSWVSGLVQYSDFEPTGTFNSSHQKLNQLHSNIVWGMRGNFLDIPTDCPQRDERMGWTGDAQVFADTSMLNAGVHSFWSAWLQSMREDQLDSGGISNVIPNITGNFSMSGWGDASTVIPWSVYHATGDINLLADNYEMMRKFVGFYEAEARDYIVSTQTVGDWLQPYSHQKDPRWGDTDETLIATAYFAYSTKLTLDAARILSKPQDVAELQALYTNIKTAFDEKYFDEDGKVTSAYETQTSYLLALGFDLLPEYKKQYALARLVKQIEKADFHLRTGFLGTPLLAEVLDKFGHRDLMFRILFNENYPSWFYSIDQGATTIWERWNGYTHKDGFIPKMNSFNHYAYGAIGEWMYKRIGGIRPLEPGYKRIGLAPRPGGPLTSAEASYESPYGLIRSEWVKTDTTFKMMIEIPPNTTAQVDVPMTFSQTLLVNDTLVSEHAKINLIQKEAKRQVFLFQPGSYTLSVE